MNLFMNIFRILKSIFATLFLALARVLNINSIVKYSGAILGPIGLILTVCLIVVQHTEKKPAQGVKTARVANLQNEEPPNLQPEKY